MNEERLKKIIEEAEEVAKKLINSEKSPPSKTQIKNLSGVLMSGHPVKGQANVLHLEKYLLHQAGRRFAWANVLLEEMKRRGYFEASYEEVESFLGYLNWCYEYEDYKKGGKR
ncbi:MAG: hypothetical protein ACP5PX_07330 [Candidatus Hadarchaeum sp.]|uniref:hypothetical protein n=1 Tax=Candidatus Hadarchaeum sp. TaxID=2883567 RepID=UPI003D0F1476